MKLTGFFLFGPHRGRFTSCHTRCLGSNQRRLFKTVIANQRISGEVLNPQQATFMLCTARDTLGSGHRRRKLRPTIDDGCSSCGLRLNICHRHGARRCLSSFFHSPTADSPTADILMRLAYLLARLPHFHPPSCGSTSFLCLICPLCSTTQATQHLRGLK